MLDTGDFTFGGKHVSEFGCAFEVTKWPLSSAPTLNKYAAPGRSGSIRYKGYTLKEKSLDGKLYLLDLDDETISYREMMDRSLKISAWLQQDERQPLILDAMPDKYYLAEIEGELSLEDKDWGNGYTTLKFTLQPFAYARKETRAAEALEAGAVKSFSLTLGGTAAAPINMRATATAPLSWLQISCGSAFIRLENLNATGGDVIEIQALPENSELLAVLINGAPSKAKMTKESAEVFVATPGRVDITLQASGACAAEVSLRARWR